MVQRNRDIRRRPLLWAFRTKPRRVESTIRYVQNLAADVKLASFYGPIPASELYRDLVESRRLKEPKTYKEWGKLAWMDTLGKNFSKVPGRDLKVISGWFLWSSISGKNRGGKTEKRIYAKKAVGQTFDALKRGTLISDFVFLSGKSFYKLFLRQCFRESGRNTTSADTAALGG